MRYVGIDWATEHHDVAVVDAEGARVEEFRIGHDAQGLAELLTRLEAAGGPQGLRLGIESGAALLLEHLLASRYTVYVINPRQAERFRDRHAMSGAKDDRLDAYVLADAVRTDGARLRVLEPDSALTEEIRLRDRARSRKVASRAELSNQLRGLLARYHPGILSLGRAMDDRFFLALLRAGADPAAAARLRPARIRDLLAEHRIRVLTAEQVLDLLRRPALRSPAHVVDALRDEALGLAAQITLLSEQIQKDEEQIEALLQRHPDRDLLQSLPGIADGLSARVIGEGGDALARLQESSQCQVLCGTAPVTRRSGKQSRGTVTMRRSCNRRLQAALFQMARASLATSRWARLYFAHQRERGVARNAALRALSNKWARILGAVLRTRTAYCEERYAASLLAHGVVWAKPLASPEAA
jgi:transposase